MSFIFFFADGICLHSYYEIILSAASARVEICGLSSKIFRAECAVNYHSDFT